MSRFIIVTIVLVISLAGQARTLVVSDIDDTIKASYVLDHDSVLGNVMMAKNSFIGMPELYRELTQLENVSGITYLSNAPKFLMKKMHRKFLKKNKYPKGELLLRKFRDLVKGPSHKLNSIRQLIRKHTPTSLLLIGDNGESDAEVYATIVEEYPEIPTMTYIRQAYSSLGFNGNFAQPLHPGQLPFASSVDVAVDLYKKGGLSMEAITRYVLKVVPLILNEQQNAERGRPMAFPEWYDCRDYILPDMPILTDVEAQTLLKKYVEKIKNRCQSVPFGS